MATVLINLALLLWGWQNNVLFLAILLALPLLIAQWIQWRLKISDKNFNRIADFTSVLFFLFIVFQFSTKSVHGIFAILAALPYLFYPLILAQYFGQAKNIPMHSLFVSMRKKSSDIDEIERINLNYPYLMVIIISASAGLKHGSIFYICIALLAALSLYSIRPRRIKRVIWIALLALSTGMGYVVQNGLKIAQSQFEVMAATFLEQMMWRNKDPDKTRTAFGYIGKLKLSDQIHVRVQSDRILTGPLLLREASYTKFGFGLWSNDDSGFESVEPTIEKEWIFSESSVTPGGTTPKNGVLGKYTISTYFKDDLGIIPLPHGMYKINNVPATEAEFNRFGAVNLGMKPGWVRYDAYFDDVMLGERMRVVLRGHESRAGEEQSDERRTQQTCHETSTGSEPVADLAALAVGELAEQHDERVDEEPDGQTAQGQQLQDGRGCLAGVETVGSEDSERHAEDQGEEPFLGADGRGRRSRGGVR